MSEPYHITLKKNLYNSGTPKYEDIYEYIEVSKSGGHFSFYGLGKNPDEDAVIKLYRNNQTFYDWCNKYRDSTLNFIETHYLVKFLDEFTQEGDVISIKFWYTILKHNMPLSNKLLKLYKTNIRKACFAYQNLTPALVLLSHYLGMQNDIVSEKECVVWIFRQSKKNKYINDKTIKDIIDNCKYDENKKYLMSKFVFEKLK